MDVAIHDTPAACPDASLALYRDVVGFGIRPIVES
jgi:hypothetical protein